MENKNLKLRSEAIRDIITATPTWSLKWGSLVILCTIILLLFLCWLIKYPDKIKASGIITSEFTPQRIMAPKEGIIDSIYVVDGQNVEKNEILAVLQNPAKTQDVLLLKYFLDLIKSEEDLSRIPLDSLRFLEIGELRESFENFENSVVEYLVNSQLSLLKLQEVSSKASLNEQNALLNSLKTKVKLSTRQLRLKRSDYERAKTLFEKGVLSKKEIEVYEYDFLNAQRELQEVNEEVNRIRYDVLGAERDTLNITAGRIMTEEKNLAAVFNSINILKKEILRWEQNYLFKSRISGKVNLLDIRVKNNHVNQGDLAFIIIPKTQGNLKIVAKVEPFNFGKIRKDQDVNLIMLNYPEQEFGILKGKISSVSLTTDQKGQYVINGILDNGLTTSYGIQVDFIYDMPVEVEIITENKRLLERLVNFVTKRID
nr:HlyD family efflux transporter periplasmic adaptor subunit [Allomuricauda sp.]